MDQNVVFVYPLNSILSQLKTELEKDTTLTIFEVDLVEEYQQLVSNLAKSITFSSDVKKTIRVLDLNKSTITKKNHYNLLVTKDLPSSLILSKMEKSGLNEALPDYTKIKVLQKKVDSFFRMAENFETEDPYAFLEKSKNTKKEDQKVERLTNDIKLQGDRPRFDKIETNVKNRSEEEANAETQRDHSNEEYLLDPQENKEKTGYEAEVSNDKKSWEPYAGENDDKRKKPGTELDYSELRKEKGAAEEQGSDKKNGGVYDLQENLKKKQHTYESSLDSHKGGAFEDESSEEKRGESSYDDLLKTNKKKKYQEDETNDSKAQSLYEGTLSKKKSAGTDLDYSQGKKKQKGIGADEDLKKDQSEFDELKKIKSKVVNLEPEKQILKVKNLSPFEEESKSSHIIVKGSTSQNGTNHSREVDFERYPEALLPEQVFYGPDKILDPVAFFVEILLGDWEPDYKKKYLKMSLLKVYKTHIYTTSLDSEWEEGAPEALKKMNLKDFDKPIWLNEGKGQDENYFVLPVAFNDKIVGALGIATPGAIDHKKMGELEFWCYLGRCLWN